MSIKLRFSVICILYRRMLPDITQILNVLWYTYQILSKCIISAKIESLKFRSYFLKVLFSRSFQLKKLPVLLCAVKTVEGDFRFCSTISPNVGQTHKENPNLFRLYDMYIK